MELKVSRLNVNKTKEEWPANTPFTPALIYKRAVTPVERWHVITAQIKPGSPPEISESYQDPYVRIPLFCYSMHPAADLALAYLLQLGLSCAPFIPNTVKKLHIVTGYPVDLLHDDDINESVGIRYWCGFAYLI